MGCPKCTIKASKGTSTLWYANSKLGACVGPVVTCRLEVCELVCHYVLQVVAQQCCFSAGDGSARP